MSNGQDPIAKAVGFLHLGEVVGEADASFFFLRAADQTWQVPDPVTLLQGDAGRHCSGIGNNNGRDVPGHEDGRLDGHRARIAECPGRTVVLSLHQGVSPGRPIYMGMPPGTAPQTQPLATPIPVDRFQRFWHARGGFAPSARPR